MDEKYAHVALLIDRSGSMVEIKDDTQGGLDHFIQIQQQVANERGLRISCQLFEFDTEYRKAVEVDDITTWPGYTLDPRGSTALLDSIIRATTETGKYLSSIPEAKRPAHVTFVIVTDGQENSSKEVTRQQVFDRITEMTTKFAWNFVFLAANQDAIDEGSKLGVAASNTMNYNRGSVGSTYAVTSDAIARSYSSTPAGTTASFDLPENAPEDQR